MTPLVDPDDFPAARRCTYLNAANVGLMCRDADRAMAAWQRDIADNGSNHFDEAAEEEVFDDLRRAGARLFGGTPNDIAAGSSATELLCSLAWAVMPGADANVVSTDIAFPTAVYPWRRVASHTGCEIRLARARNGYVDPEELTGLIDGRTAVVCLSHVEYRSGQRYDLAAFAERAHAYGALLVVDVTQSAGAVPIDAPGEGVDALVCGAYKWLCGPFGAALMYLAPHLHTRLEPGLVGFRSNTDIWDIDAGRLTYPDTARRFEFSTMAYGCGIGLARAIEYLLSVGIDRIWAYNQRLSDALIEGLETLGAQVTSPRKLGERSAIVTARFPGRDPAGVAARLKAADVWVVCRGDIVRFSPHLYNRMEDVARALEVLEGI
jgi:selenocysteine lyase/cysteine desulfurase